MKGIACLFGLCLLAGAINADSDFAWEEGKQYRYKVRGRAMTGISGINNQYAGLEMDYYQIITVKQPGVLNVKTEDLKVIDTNEQFQNGGWRDGEIVKGEEPSIPAEMRQFITSPMDLIVKKGVVDSIKVEGDLPTWAVNMKRAMASTFSLDTIGQNQILRGNLNRPTEGPSTEEFGTNQELGFFYKVFEESIHGKCPAYYTVSQSGSFSQAEAEIGNETTSSEEQQEDGQKSSKEQVWTGHFNQLCEESDHVYEVTKTINYTACAEKPVLSYISPAGLNYRPADNSIGSLASVALISRYIACGLSRQNYTILKITQQEHLETGLLESEKIFSGAQKNVTLISIGQGRATPVRNPKTIPSLVYEFDSIQEEAEQNWNGQQQQQQQLTKPSLDKAPLNPILLGPLKREGLKSRVITLMQEVAQGLTKSTDKKDSIAEREILSKISTVVKALRFFDRPEIEELAHKLTERGNEQQEVTRRIFLDALAIAGTNPTVVYLLEQVKAGQLSGEEAAQTLSTLPMYIRTPTKELIQKFFEIIEEEAVKRHLQVCTTAMLSFSNLLFNACVDKKIKNTRYPVAVYGEFCEPSLVEKYLPYFIQKLEKHLEPQTKTQQDQHWIATLLTVLGNIGHPDTIPLVQKIMDEQSDSFIKTKAIFSLKNLVESRSELNQNQQEQRAEHLPTPVDRQSRDPLTNEVVRQQVLPLLASVAFNRGEDPQVRNAAFSLLFHCTYADIAMWQQIAMSTWFERSREVRSYVSSFLKSLTELDTPIRGRHWTMHEKALAVLPLAKPIDIDINIDIARSHQLFSAKFSQELNSGFAQELGWFQGADSILPTNFYYKNYNQFGTGAIGIHPLELSVAGNTIQKLANAFVNVFQGQQQQDRQQQQHPELSQIQQLLNIASRQQDEPVQGSIHLKLYDEIERMWTFDPETIQQLAQQIGGNVNGNGELKVNYQKATHLVEHVVSMPTILGLPMVYSMQIPALISIRGTIKIQGQQQQGQQGEQGYSVQADLSAVFAMKLHRKIAFKIPFTRKKYEAGVERHFVVEAPFSAVARKDPQGQLQLAITPTHLSARAPSGSINLFTYEQIPYTAIITDDFYPINKNNIRHQGGKMQIVHANQDQDSKDKKSLGQKALGLAFEIKEEFPAQEENMIWAKYRYVKRQVVLDLEKSETKTVVLLLAAENQGSLHNSSSFSSSESTESGQLTNQSGGKILAVALLGKKAPLASIDKFKSTIELQRPLQKKNSNTVQYLAQLNLESGKLFLRLATGSAAKEAAESLPESPKAFKSIREAITEASNTNTNTKNQQELCVEFQGTMETPKRASPHIIAIRRQTLLAQDLIVNVQGKIQAGQNCRVMPLFVKIQGKLRRDSEMTEWAQVKSPQAKKCNKDEKKGFSISHVCMTVAEQQAAALNEYKFTIEHSAMPKEIQNMTVYPLQNFLKAALYPYMSENQFPEEEQQQPTARPGTFQIHARITPNKQFVNFEIRKPNSVLSFNNIKTGRVLKTLLPLTATQTPYRNIKDRLFRTQGNAMCAIEKNYVNTFDNLKYSFNKDAARGCEHLLVKDCSDKKKYPMAVLIKDLQQNKGRQVTVILGAQKIQLIPKGQASRTEPMNPTLQSLSSESQEASRMTVLVNGQQQQHNSLPITIRNPGNKRDIVAQVMEISNGGVQVISRHVQVASDGARVILYGSNELRNRTCGICGDFDGEKVAEMKSPKNLPLSSGTLLVASYAFPSLNREGQCQVDQQVQRQLRREE